jgi:hypothetical protein
MPFIKVNKKDVEKGRGVSDVFFDRQTWLCIKYTLIAFEFCVIFSQIFWNIQDFVSHTFIVPINIIHTNNFLLLGVSLLSFQILWRRHSFVNFLLKKLLFLPVTEVHLVLHIDLRPPFEPLILRLLQRFCVVVLRVLILVGWRRIRGKPPVPKDTKCTIRKSPNCTMYTVTFLCDSNKIGNWVPLARYSLFAWTKIIH